MKRSEMIQNIKTDLESIFHFATTEDAESLLIDIESRGMLPPYYRKEAEEILDNGDIQVIDVYDCDWEPENV